MPRVLPGILILVLFSCAILAGCAQSQGSGPEIPAAPVVSMPAPDTTDPPPAAGATSTPQPAATIVRFISPPEDLKDTQLLFTLQVPSLWNVSTVRMTRSDFPDYRTDLVAGGAFSVFSYPASRSREQEFRDGFRRRFPAAIENAVTINGIRYDRFEGAGDGNTTVWYIARTSSANERGYSHVLAFTVPDSDRFEWENFESVVASFRHFGIGSAAAVPGREIPLLQQGDLTVRQSATGKSITETSDWDTAEGGSPYENSGEDESPSPGGGGCQRGA